MVLPDCDGDCTEEDHERTPPGDSVNYDGLCVGGGELVDDSAEKGEVDNWPSKEGPNAWGDVRLLNVPVGIPWKDHPGTDNRHGEEGVRDEVGRLEAETFPVGRSHFGCPGRSRGECRRLALYLSNVRTRPDRAVDGPWPPLYGCMDMKQPRGCDLLQYPPAVTGPLAGFVCLVTARSTRGPCGSERPVLKVLSAVTDLTCYWCSMQLRSSWLRSNNVDCPIDPHLRGQILCGTKPRAFVGSFPPYRFFPLSSIQREQQYVGALLYK